MKCFRPRNLAGNGLGLLPVLLALLLPLWSSPSARAVTGLKAGDAAPAFTVQDGAGKEVASSAFKGRPTVLIFGELYHEKTRQACKQVQDVLQDPRLVGQDIAVAVLITQELTEDARAKLNWESIPRKILLDPKRNAFGAFDVVVMPSVVVLDAQWRVVYVVAGLTPRFSDLIAGALLVGVGSWTPQRLEEAIKAQDNPASEADLHVQRLGHLADQLAQRGLDDLAAEKYTEVLVAAPKYEPAHLGLGNLMLKRRRLPEAEAHFQAVLAEDAKSIEASLGMAFVQVLRGGEELPQAEKRVRAVLATHARHPQAHYLLGLIYEQRHEAEPAAASFKKAAELLMERTSRE